MTSHDEVTNAAVAGMDASSSKGMTVADKPVNDGFQVEETVVGDMDDIEQRLSKDNDATGDVKNDDIGHAIDELENKNKKSWFAYLMTRDFYIVLVLG
jgi:hypothetical protein